VCVCVYIYIYSLSERFHLSNKHYKKGQKMKGKKSNFTTFMDQFHLRIMPVLNREPLHNHLSFKGRKKIHNILEKLKVKHWLKKEYLVPYIHECQLISLDLRKWGQ